MIPCVKPITVPFELYPPHEMTVLDIRLPDFPDSAFRIWLPEMVSVSGRGEVYNQAIDGPQHWRCGKSNGCYECSVFQSELLRVGSSLDLVERRASLRYEVENLSETPLLDIELTSCYQLAHASSLRDMEGQRTYAWVNSRLANVGLEGSPPQCNDHHDPDKSSFLALHSAGRGIGIIGVEARSGAATAMAWETHRQYTGNTDPFLCCLHADPVVPKLEPGQHMTILGLLGWSTSGLEGLCTELREELKVQIADQRHRDDEH